MARRSYQRGWIEEVKEGCFFIRYRVRTKEGWRIAPREALPEGTTRKEALARLDEAMLLINKRNNVPDLPTNGTFAQFTEGVWRCYTELKGVKPSTLYGYSSMLKKHVLPVLGNLVLRRITVSDMTDFFTKVRHQKPSDKYLLNLYALLNIMFEVAKEHDLIETVPLRRKIHRPKCRRTKKTALSIMQLAAFLEMVERERPEHKALFWTVAVLGLRVGELLALRWRRIDFDNMKVFVTENLWRGQAQSSVKTEGSEAWLPMPKALADVLLDHRQARNTFGLADADDFVFGRLDGTPGDPDHLRRYVLYPLLEKTEIERKTRCHGFHLFRHSGGSAVSIACGIKVGQEYLRHQDYKTTANIYWHLDDAALRQATELLAGQLVGAMSSDRISSVTVEEQKMEQLLH